MDRYVAFLRGVNLGGRRITNEELRSHFEALGCGDVATFRASGNVVFVAVDTAETKLATRLEAGLAERLDYEVPVFLRSAAELKTIVARAPFEARHLKSSNGKLQIAFLGGRPRASAAEAALAHATDADRLAIQGRELYWLPDGGLSESELDLKALAEILGPTTIRTKGTVDQIAAKYLD
jgi:uncharacterized protein (DUF1697 family)